jgi:hypothetical protein
MTTPNKSDVDRAALNLAWEMYLQREPDTFRDGTRDDKEFAAFSLQCDNLKLTPWQEPPMHLSDGSDPGPDDHDAYKIMKRMQKAGVSIYHPDPLRALAEAERHK